MGEIDPEANEIEYSLPLAVKAFMGAIGLFFLGVCLYLTGTLFTGEFSESGMSDHSPVVTGIILIGGFLISGLFFWLASPRDISLDLGRHTYRLREGLPLLARWYRGDKNDIAGLFVQRQPIKEGEHYFLMIDWRVPGRRDTRLGFYTNGNVALRHAKRLGERLGVEFAEVIRGKSATAFPVHAGMALAACAFGYQSVFGLALSIPPLLKERALDARGRETTGIVTHVSSPGNRGGRSVYCDYTVNGNKLHKRFPVLVAQDRLPPIGAKITVTYLPEDPKVSRISLSEGMRHLTPVLVSGIVATFFTIGFLIAAVWLWRRSRFRQIG